jgi:alpha-L-fucosidase
MNSGVRPTVGDSAWFIHDRFGLFIHWGLYSVPARHEWVKAIERTADGDYQKYFNYFEPDLYDPAAWADAAADAGMKYFVVTAKHHEGFCLWDTKQTQYKAPLAPNCGRDLLRPMAEAFRGRGLKVGFYYSLIDWHHPHYWIDNRNHPQRALISPEGAGHESIFNSSPPVDQAGHFTGAADPNSGRDQAIYARYLHEQVRELLTDYGPVDLMWFDFSFPPLAGFARSDFSRGKGREAWQSEALLKMIRKLRPGVLLGNRLDLPDEPANWDFATPEQAQPRAWVEVDGRRVVWEACQTLSGSWGYHRDEACIRCLIDCVSKGGNLLLNVGPTGRGEFDSRALERLRGIGRWMKYHSRSIYGCTEAPAEFNCPADCRLTFNREKRRLYVHLFAYPYKHLHLDGEAFRERVDYAQFLHDASEIKIGLDPWHAGQIGGSTRSLVLNLPQTRPDAAIPVVELYLK